MPEKPRLARKPMDNLQPKKLVSSLVRSVRIVGRMGMVVCDGDLSHPRTAPNPAASPFVVFEG